MNVFDWISRWAFYFPEKIALRENETGRTLTYRFLNNLANYTSRFLREHFGIKRGDRVAILAENCLEFFVLFSAAQKSGFILVPLNYRLAPSEFEFLVNDCRPSLMITENKYKEKIQALNINSVLLEEFAARIWSSFDKPQNEEAILLDENDPLFILYTSGTTGTPKGAIYTHKMLFWNSVNTTMRLDITSEDHSISCTPLFHTGGWNVIPTPFLHRGASVTLMKKFDPDEVLRLLEKEEATMFMAVPTMLQMMAKSPEFEKVKLKSMRYFIIGGEPMPLPLIDLWHKKGVPIRQGYGLTEAGPSITSLHQSDAVRKRGSIGTPNFYLDIRIVDEENRDMKQGEIGELLLKGPVVTPGYWKNEAATRSVFTDGWFHTGDLVRMDEEGYLYIMDRKKNMYISGGENVYPAEVEKVLLTHPAIEEVAIIGIPDEKWGESGLAFVVVKNGMSLDGERIIDFLREKVAGYKIPKHFQFVDALPKTDTGKLDRKALKKLANPQK